MSTYVSELLQNERESYDSLVNVLKFLTEQEVEMRQLQCLKAVFVR
jgi:hypothetical protein